MWTPSERWRSPLALPGLAAALALALAAMLSAKTQPESPAPSGGAQQHAVAKAPMVQPVVPPSQLDFLRVAATIGDLEAGQLLVTQLLDQYERAGDTDDLFEAVQWIDREWGAGSYQQSGLATRVFERYCTHKVLRWHWLCDVGE